MRWALRSSERSLFSSRRVRRGRARESWSKPGSRRAAVTVRSRAVSTHAGMVMMRRRRRSAIAARSSRRVGSAENEAGTEAEADAESEAESDPKSGPRRSRARSAARTSVSRERTERNSAHRSMIDRSSPGGQSRSGTVGSDSPEASGGSARRVERFSSSLLWAMTQ